MTAYYKNNEWRLSENKVKFIDSEEEITKFVGSEGKVWWTELAKKHNEIDILEFIEIEHSEEKMTRLEEINQLNLPDGFGSVLSDYVENGTFPDEADHILKDLELKKLRVESKMLKAQSKAHGDSIEFTDDVMQELIMATLNEGGE